MNYITNISTRRKLLKKIELDYKNIVLEKYVRKLFCLKIYSRFFERVY